MARLSALGAVALSLLAASVTAQTTTDCQPLNTTGCPADPAFGTDYTFNFNSTPVSGTWDTTAGTVTYDVDNGATFTINEQGDSPTIRTSFYIFFGRTEIWMKTAPGTGIVSSVMFLSDDLDEIDWEFMGGNGTHAETNYFGKGVEDYLNAIYYPVTNGTQADYHNYTTMWTPTALDFYIDSEKVRTLLPADANDTQYYPQTPSRISIGIWAGGDPSLANGTREWAGGTTNYTQGPFTMYVKSVQISDYNTGKEYTYGNHSGSWESIEITAGNSTAYDALHSTSSTSTSESISDKWNNMSSGAHVAVYASAAGAGALIVAAGLYYCIKQRQRGAKEALLAQEKQAQENRDLEEFHRAGINPDGLTHSGTEYNARDLAGDTAWGAAAVGGGAAGAAAARPLLQDPPQSPIELSPHSPHNPFADPHSPGLPGSPARTASPGMAPGGYPLPNNAMPGSPGPGPVPGNPTRSFSTPGVQMRSEQVATAMPFGAPPLRSYTADPFQGHGEPGSLGAGGPGSYGYGGPHGGNGNGWR